MTHLHHFFPIHDHSHKHEGVAKRHPIDVSVDDVRHIEFTSDDHGETIIILHLKSTGDEYILDGEDQDTIDGISSLLAEAGIH